MTKVFVEQPLASPGSAKKLTRQIWDLSKTDDREYMDK